jgi:hypothetical protein
MKKNGREWSNYVDQLFYSKIDLTSFYPEGICIEKKIKLFLKVY